MTVRTVTFHRVEAHGRQEFISRLQASFTKAAVAFGHHDSEPVISGAEIREAMDTPHADTWDVRASGSPVGGVVVTVDKDGGRGALDLLFVDTCAQGQGVGAAMWRAIEALYPDVAVWETVTPYADKRNVHFYVNKCGFHVVEFFHPGHPDPNEPHDPEDPSGAKGPSEMLALEKALVARGDDVTVKVVSLRESGDDVVEFSFNV